MDHLWVILLLKPPFMGDLPLPCLITRRYIIKCIPYLNQKIRSANQNNKARNSSLYGWIYSTINLCLVPCLTTQSSSYPYLSHWCWLRSQYILITMKSHTFTHKIQTKSHNIVISPEIPMKSPSKFPFQKDHNILSNAQAFNAQATVPLWPKARVAAPQTHLPTVGDVSDGEILWETNTLVTFFGDFLWGDSS